MTHLKIDHLIQAITVNVATLGFVWITNVNDILQMILLLSSIAFGALKWRDRIVDKKRKRKKKDD